MAPEWSMNGGGAKWSSGGALKHTKGVEFFLGGHGMCSTKKILKNYLKNIDNQVFFLDNISIDTLRKFMKRGVIVRIISGFFALLLLFG